MQQYILVDCSRNFIKDYAVIVLDAMEGEDDFTWSLSTTDCRDDATKFNSIQHAVGMLKLICGQPENYLVDIYKEEK